MTDPELRSWLVAQLHARGFATITAFAESQPWASLRHLADDLRADRSPGPSPDVNVRQLASLWREEVALLGPAWIEHMARRLLVGELAAAIPKGWLARWTDTHDARAAASDLSLAFARWSDYVGPSRRAATARLSNAMFEDGYAGRIPPGWLPRAPDDAILVELFARHWNKAPSTAGQP